MKYQIYDSRKLRHGTARVIKSGPNHGRIEVKFQGFKAEVWQSLRDVLCAYRLGGAR